ncbi:metallophosphoesterase family protein [Halobellus rarus]|uniref:Phosphoesterase n=1 Tax=Halobellus rarus TaxID=1126237 RepID=A0ABD6CJK7_9EURY|nr:metallophosphoesterase family protein [Halobellus rarus]
MAVELALVSDTHVPSRADAIPTWVQDRIRAADHVVHAGDFDSAEAYDRIVELAGGEKSLTAVVGNIDPGSFDLPVVERLRVEDATFVVTHGAGPRRGYRSRVAGTVREEAGPEALGVSGHTHETLDEVVDGVRLLNPGTATGAPPGSEATMYVATVDGASVSVTLHSDEGE